MKNIKITLGILLLLFISLYSLGQTNQEKTEFIINKMGLADVYRLQIIDFKLKPLKWQVTGKDSIRLNQIEAQLTDQEILKRIATAFDETFTPEEINDIYSFIQKTAYNKLVAGKSNKLILTNFEDINNELDQLLENVKGSKYDLEFINTPQKKFSPLPINREDGFYKTIDFSITAEFKDIKLEKNPSLTPKDFQEVRKEYHSSNNKPEISIVLTKTGARKFYLLTKECIGKPIAIVVDKHIVSAPVVQSEIMGGKVTISGNFTEKEIDSMILKLKGK